MDYILEVKNLRKEYKDFVLKDVNFALEKGYIMGFIGPNGAGKSTTIMLIMNLLKRDGGEIKVFGLDNLKAEREIKERIGFVYDENHYYDELTISETKRIIAPFYNNWNEAVFNSYLHKLDLPPKKKIKDLSKGMKMKFALAMALSHQAELIIMDEPTAGLDPIVRSELLDILAELIQDENKGVIFSTHLIADLDKVADFITFIDNGEIVFSGSREAIRDSYGLIKGGKEVLCPELKRELIGIRENSYGFEALTANVRKVRELVKDRAVIERPTLEEIMLFKVRGKKNV